MQKVYEIMQDVNNIFEPNEIRIWTWLHMRDPLFLGNSVFSKIVNREETSHGLHYFSSKLSLSK